ncbi:MAG: RNA methyltransferase [Candidatus Eremiobacteraeota bacterium]|nr:RNA methyltransferase [Candidatus Eremiobacteraeota bacterium]MBC5801820.1 RNA methyltransferase [Candidatus Eremiobacteraeota bacterium]MBC5820492.1 RNA methyltransferase [Candidatus Eremiobacteraeota bacterium]
MSTLLGSHSPRLAAVRALLTKRARREQGRFTVEGLTLLGEALAAGHRPEAVYGTEAGVGTLGPLETELADRIFVVAPRDMRRLSPLETPPEIVAVYRQALTDPADLLDTGAPALVLGGVADPGNAGTLLRSADIFGFSAAIFATGAVEPYNPKLVRATMGALFRLRLAVAEPDGLAALARRRGYALVVADPSGSPLPAFAFPSKSLIVVGHERQGTGAWLSHADSVVAVPQCGRGDSLNAAIAGSIIMYAFSQQFGHRNGAR